MAARGDRDPGEPAAEQRLLNCSPFTIESQPWRFLRSGCKVAENMESLCESRRGSHGAAGNDILAPVRYEDWRHGFLGNGKGDSLAG